MRRAYSYSYSYSDGWPSQPIISPQKTNNWWPGARRVECGHSNPPEKRNVFESYGRIKLTASFGSRLRRPYVLEVQVCALGFSEKDKNIRCRRAINLLGQISSRACWSTSYWKSRPDDYRSRLERRGFSKQGKKSTTNSDGSPSQPIISPQKTNNWWPGCKSKISKMWSNLFLLITANVP